MEKRRHKRINVKVGVAVYLPNMVDFEGFLVNISEVGVCLRIDNSDEKYTDLFKKGTKLKLQGSDEYKFLGYTKIDIFTCDMHVIHIKNDDKYIYLGCVMNGLNENFQEYAIGKQIEEMMLEF